MLVELGLVEQRCQAVLEVLGDGARVTDVARRNGVSRQAVHEWLVRYANHGLAGLADRRAGRCRAGIRWPRRSRRGSWHYAGSHPGWGPRTILYWLAWEGVAPLPGVHVGGAVPGAPWAGDPRRGGGSARISSAGSGPGRWSCGRWTWWVACTSPMGPRRRSCRASTTTAASIVSGIDDYSRFAVCARVVARATGPAGVRRAGGGDGGPWGAGGGPDR